MEMPMKTSTKTATTIFFGTAMALTSTMDASAATYTVKAGDSLSKIGSKYGVSYQTLMQQNGLSSTVIHVGQILKVNKSTSKSPSTTKQPSTTSSKSTYTVKAGDSLSKIASRYGTSYQKLMTLNNLSSTTIFVGQKLTVSGKKTTTAPSSDSSTTSSSSNTSSKSYIVKSGDSLSKIAAAHGTTYQKLMTLNNLSSTTIFVGQKLTVSGKVSTPAPSTGSSSNSSTTTETASSNSSTYTVKAGDSLSKIAAAHGTTYQKLMTLNNLSSTTIFVGQKLTVSGKVLTASTNTTDKTPSTTPVSNSDNVIANAYKHLGVPYVFGGSSPRGFDCSGFIYYVYNQSGKNMGRTNAAGYYNMAKKTSTPRVGDLVFFSGTYKSGISHVGFYIGNGQMISAASSGIKVDSIHTGYWSKYFTGYGSL